MTTSSNDRRARRHARREEARRAGAAHAARNRWLIPGLLAVVIVVAAAIAIFLPGLGGAGQGGSSSLPPTTAPGSGASASATAGSSAAPVITGAALPAFQYQLQNANVDPAVGLPAPEVRAADFAGKQVAIANDGRPKVILFIAHWCPHCQREVPLIQAWVNSGGVPSGVDLISVATSIDPARPNYPPDAWLAREGWTVPVIADPTNSVAGAYGLPAFPYWVFVGPDGNVRARAVGELTIDTLKTAIDGLRG
jgi:cytochrome c biogenesis protein CcmG/thiol:disulfide interchange protein DsbE